MENWNPEIVQILKEGANSLSPKRTPNSNALSSASEKYCTDCQMDITSSLQQHRLTKEHKKIFFLNHSFCAECDMFLPSPGFYVEHCTEVHHGLISSVHPSSERLQEKLRSEESSTAITKFCKDCHITLACSSLHHEQTEAHKKTNFLNHSFCAECNVFLPSPTAYVEHCEEVHQGVVNWLQPSWKRLQVHLRSIELTSIANFNEFMSIPNSKQLRTVSQKYCTDCKTGFTCSVKEHKDTEEHRRIDFLNRSFCVLCDVFLQTPVAYLGHCKEVHEGIISKVYPSFERLQEKLSSIESYRANLKYCKDCQIELACSFDQHINTEEHKRIKILIRSYCAECDSFLKSPTVFDEHCFLVHHREIRRVHPTLERLKVQLRFEGSRLIILNYCKECQIHITCSLDQHKQTEEHKRIESLIRSFCVECNVFLRSPTGFVEHCYHVHQGIIRWGIPSNELLKDKLRSQESCPAIQQYCKECQIHISCSLDQHKQTKEHKAGHDNRSQMQERNQGPIKFKKIRFIASSSNEPSSSDVVAVVKTEKAQKLPSKQMSLIECEAGVPKPQFILGSQIESPESSTPSHAVVVDIADETDDESVVDIADETDDETEMRDDASEQGSCSLESKRGPVGLTSVVRISGFYCKVCRKLLKDEPEAKSSHCKSKEHCSKFKVIVKAIKVERQ